MSRSASLRGLSGTVSSLLTLIFQFKVNSEWGMGENRDQVLGNQVLGKATYLSLSGTAIGGDVVISPCWQPARYFTRCAHY